MKINNLTDEQKALFSTYVDKWTKIGLSTDPIDVQESLSALRQGYENVNIPFPEKYEVYDSPFQAIHFMKEKYGLDITPNDFIYGAHDSPWVSFYSYFDEVLNIDIHDKIDPFIRLAKSCGWVLLFDELVVLTKKPIHIKFDDQNRVHCADDYAIKYADDAGVAIWHGQMIPSDWIFDKSTITPDILLHWENIEQRRCACEIIGWATVLKQLNAKVIDADEDPTIGKLLEVDLPDAGTEKFLLAIDPNTGKEVGLPVPEEMKTALEANSWTYGIDKFEFKPDFRV